MKLAAGLAAIAAGGVVAACAAAIPPSVPPAAALSPTKVERGAELARLGDCQTCHTAEQGAPFAGGRPIGTPFGQVFATNITPDRETGIGAYSQAAFARAMRQGLRRDGAELYPAFPYDHFSYADGADFDALYAFLMTRRAVRQATPVNRLIPPVGFRPVVAIWKALYFRPEPFRPTPGKSDQWNRGAYLVQSFGHCGGCHTPRNALGAEQKAKAFDGGWVDGWYAPPLNASTPAAMAWTEPRLFTYLRTGLDADHAAAAGPMGAVAHELARAPQADVQAMAVYLADIMKAPPRSPTVDRAADAAARHPRGAALFAGACAGCHDAGAPMMRLGRPALYLGTPLHEDDPRDTIQIVLQGLKPPVGAAGPYMPAFGSSFTDAQVAEIAAYLRSRFSERPAWSKLPAAVAAARKGAAA
jgi:mono/diheme cytochrome c family protein